MKLLDYILVLLLVALLAIAAAPYLSKGLLR